MDHLIGIGGVGMSALAQALIARGGQGAPAKLVSGADRAIGQSPQPSTLARLASQGVRIYPDDGSGIDGSVGRVIVSTAIEEDNPVFPGIPDIVAEYRGSPFLFSPLCCSKQYL